MPLRSVVQSLDVELPIDLFIISNASVPGYPSFYFCNYLNAHFAGTYYQAIACQCNWLDKNSEGAEPETTLVVSDVSGVVGQVIDDYGVIGSDLYVRRTWSYFLDGKSTADPNAYTDFILKINNYTGEYGKQFEFTCVPEITLERKQIPARSYLRRCQWVLSDENCMAPTNINYDLAGNSTTADQRACGKDTVSCLRYHGSLDRFGGFSGCSLK